MPIIAALGAALTAVVGYISSSIGSFLIQALQLLVKIVEVFFNIFLSLATWLTNNFKSDNIYSIVLGLVVAALIIILAITTVLAP